MNQEEAIEFIFDKTTRRPKRLENNVFIFYAPEKIRVQPGEMMSVNTKVKTKFSKNIIGTCMLLQTFSDYGLKLMNSNTIAQEINVNIQNHLCINENDLPPPCNLTFELFNKSFSNVFHLRKKQEIGYFMILNDGGKEIRFTHKKEH